MRTAKARQLVGYERDSEASYLRAVFGCASKKIHTIPLYSESAVRYSEGQGENGKVQMGGSTKMTGGIE